MNAREYREHREFSRMRLIETVLLLAGVGIILIAGAASYVVAIAFVRPEPRDQFRNVTHPKSPGGGSIGSTPPSA